MYFFRFDTSRVSEIIFSAPVVLLLFTVHLRVSRKFLIVWIIQDLLPNFEFWDTANTKLSVLRRIELYRKLGVLRYMRVYINYLSEYIFENNSTFSVFSNFKTYPRPFLFPTFFFFISVISFLPNYLWLYNISMYASRTLKNFRLLQWRYVVEIFVFAC